MFGKKSKNQNAWKHKFLCLAYCDQTRIPTTDVEKDDLLQAGLGEKEIIFKDIDIDAEEFRDENYPALQNGGGFQFYRCIPNTRNLEKLSATTL